MSNKELSTKRKKPGVPSRKLLYAKVAKHAVTAINTLVEEAKKPTKMGSVRIAAARTLLNKVLPDLKAQDVKIEGTGENGEILLKFTKDENTGS